MKRVLKAAGILCMAVLPLAGAGGRAPQGAATSGDVKVVDAVVYESIAARDGAQLEKILDGDFLLTNTFGEVYDKNKFLEGCCAGGPTSKIQYLGATDAQVKKYGDTAVIVARTEMRFTRDNQDLKLVWRSTRVYVKSSNRWKLVAEQRTSL